MSTRSLCNAGISTESTASLTAEVTTESRVLCCSLNASLIPLAIASSISSLVMVESLNFFFIGDCPISLFRSPLTVEYTHDESDAKWFEFYWQDNKIFDKVSRAKDYACIEVEGSRDPLLLCFLIKNNNKSIFGFSLKKWKAYRYKQNGQFSFLVKRDTKIANSKVKVKVHKTQLLT